MSRLQNFLLKSKESPLLIIQIMLAVVLLVVGTYVIGPWYVGGPTTAMGVILESTMVRVSVATFYLFSGVITLTGIGTHRPRWRYWGTFCITLSYTFMALLRLFTFGLTPIMWLLVLLLGLVAAVIFLWEAGRDEA